LVDNDTIESYLIRMDLRAEALGEGVWSVDDADDGLPPVIVSHNPPILEVRLKVMDLPAAHRLELYEKLLNYNASGIAFGAYAIQAGQVFLIDTLRTASLDMSDLHASLESLLTAATEHYAELSALIKGQE